MYHPRPQHLPSAQRYLTTDFTDVSQSYRSTTSSIRGNRSFSASEVQATAELPHHAMSVHPPIPSAEHRTPEAYQGFQLPTNPYPAGSPTFALRPVTAAPFSHIEYPSVAHARTQSLDSYRSLDDYESGSPHEPVAPPFSHLQQSGDQSYSFRQAPYEPNGVGRGESELRDQRALELQACRGSAERSPNAYDFGHASQPMDRMDTVKPTMRRRLRNDSDSSVASMWSSAAVLGDSLHEETRSVNSRFKPRRGSMQSSGRFQPQAIQSAYAYEYASAAHDATLPGAMGVPEHNGFPSSPAMDVDPPYVLPPPPRTSELGLRDPEHPFVSGRADWEGSFGDMSVASTDVDAGSPHSQDQLSSRASSEPSNGPSRKRKGGTMADSPDVAENGEGGREGRKKTVMACHFCRYRKLRCDSGHPCGHCHRRGKECTYDAVVRRRGPGRKNKSAQETARVQLANRQREEAAREAAVATKPAPKEQPVREQASRGNAKEGAFRDAWSQTSPQPPNQASAALSGVSGTPYSPDAPFQQSRAAQDQVLCGQEYQPFSLGYAYGSEQTSRSSHEWAGQDVLPPSLASLQRGEEHRRGSSGPLPNGLQTPISGASSYYDGSPDRYQQPQYASSVHGYASNRYSFATQGGETSYSNDAESAYAYSEGANVLPYGYEPQFEGRQQQRSDLDAHFRRVNGVSQYPSEAATDGARMANTFTDGRAKADGGGGRR